MTKDERRYHDALVEIISVMEPLGWRCPEHSCMGCDWEHDHVLELAMDALAGIHHVDYLGPAHSREERKAHAENPETCEVCIKAAQRGQSSQQLHQAHHEAWRKAGFYTVPSKVDPSKLLWRPAWTKDYNDPGGER